MAKPNEWSPTARRYLLKHPEMMPLVEQATCDIHARLPDAKIRIAMDREEPRQVIILEVRSVSITMDTILGYLEPLRKDYYRRSQDAGGAMIITI